MSVPQEAHRRIKCILILLHDVSGDNVAHEILSGKVVNAKIFTNTFQEILVNFEHLQIILSVQ